MYKIYSGMVMNKKIEKFLNFVWYIVIMILIKNSVIMMLYCGIGIFFKFGIWMWFIIKNVNVINMVIRMIFGMVCENNVKKVISFFVVVIGILVKYFIEVEDGVILNCVKWYVLKRGNNFVMYNLMIL